MAQSGDALRASAQELRNAAQAKKSLLPKMSDEMSNLQRKIDALRVAHNNTQNEASDLESRANDMEIEARMADEQEKILNS